MRRDQIEGGHGAERKAQEVLAQAARRHGLPFFPAACPLTKKYAKRRYQGYLFE